MAKSHGKEAALKGKTVPALGAGVRCVVRRAGILADPPPPVKKVLAGALKTACPPLREKFSPRGNAGEGAAWMQRDLVVCCGDAAGQGLALRWCSGMVCGFLPGGLPSPDSQPHRVPAGQPTSLPAEGRMRSVSELDTGRLEAPKACA